MRTRGVGWLAGIVALSVVGWTGAALAGATKVYVADEEGDTVTVLDATSFAKLATIPVGREPHNIQVSPDGRWAWVTINSEVEGKTKGPAKHAPAAMPRAEHEAMTAAGQVWVIDTATDRLVDKIRVGKHPAHVVLSPDGRFAYVTNGGDDTVSVIETATRTALATIPVGAYPHGIRVSPDGREAYVANLKDGSVSVIDTEARKEIAKIAVGKGPAQVGFAPEGPGGHGSDPGLPDARQPAALRRQPGFQEGTRADGERHRSGAARGDQDRRDRPRSTRGRGDP
jgi:YVTN family beta-propeller protein